MYIVIFWDGESNIHRYQLPRQVRSNAYSNIRLCSQVNQLFVIRYPPFAFSVKSCKIVFCPGFFSASSAYIIPCYAFPVSLYFSLSPPIFSGTILYIVFERKSNSLNDCTCIHYFSIHYTALRKGFSYPCASMKWSLFRIERIDAFQTFSAKCEIEWNW